MPDLINPSQPPPPKPILTILLNEGAAHDHNIVLVLDDYHLIDSRTVDEALAFLLDHLPPQLHLVITTREDPQLPLPRLRARAQLIELRAAGLRLTTAEAAEFLAAMNESTMLGWFKALPDVLFRNRPVLSANDGEALLAVLELGAVAAHLQDAEQWLDTTDPTSDVPAHPGAAEPAMVNVYDEDRSSAVPRHSESGERCVAAAT